MPEPLFMSSQGWPTISLGELCSSGGGDIQTGPFGSQLHASDYVPTGIPSVMPQNIGDNSIMEDGIARIDPKDAQRLSRYLLRDRDIVYSRRGDVTRRALVRPQEEGWLCGTGCLRVRVGSAANARFISYHLGHPDVREWIMRHAVGATMPNLNTTILGSLPVTLPTVREQEAVAAALGALDDKIAVNDRMVTTAEALLKNLVQTALDKPSRRIKLRDLIDLKYGKALRAGDRRAGRIPVFGGNGISGSHDTALVRGPGIIVGRKGANAGSVSWSSDDFWPIDTAFYIVPLSTEISLEFLFSLLRRVDLRGMVGDSAIPGLNRGIALSIEVEIPDLPAIHSFTANTQQLFTLQAQMHRETKQLVELRDTLLPKLMSGEIRVRDAEKVVEEVT